MKNHTEQVQSTLRRNVQAVLQDGLADPRVRGLTTVTKVELSRDGRQATVYVSIMPEEHAELSMHGIRHASKHIRSRVAERMSIRHMPALHFRLDSSLKKQTKVLRAIQDAGERPGPTEPITDAHGDDLQEDTNS